jgi:hypothetical protein
MREMFIDGERRHRVHTPVCDASWPRARGGPMMPRIGVAVLMGLSLVAGSVGAENHAFESSKEVKQGEERPGFTNKVMVKTATEQPPSAA